MKKFSFLFISTAAILWGIIGILVKKLYYFGLDSFQIVSIRAVSSCIVLVLFLLLTNKQQLKIKSRDMVYFIGTGILSFVFFNWCYFIAIDNTSLAIAAILLYTAPAFVCIFSIFIFKEKLTLRKVISLVLTFIGCVLVTGYFQSKGQRVSLTGVLAGLGSGLGYALYSIFGKVALKKYDPITITTYTFIFASIGLIPLTDFSYITNLYTNISFVFYSMALVFLSTILPFILYTKGLSYLQPSTASIIATLEPVVATLLGIFLFKEGITISKILGVGLVIAAIVVLSKGRDRDYEKEIEEGLNIEIN